MHWTEVYLCIVRHSLQISCWDDFGLCKNERLVHIFDLQPCKNMVFGSVECSVVRLAIKPRPSAGAYKGATSDEE